MRGYIVTVHHRDDYRSIDVFSSERTKRDALRTARRQVEALGAPGPWRATYAERVEG